MSLFMKIKKDLVLYSARSDFIPKCCSVSSRQVQEAKIRLSKVTLLILHHFLINFVAKYL